MGEASGYLGIRWNLRIKDPFVPEGGGEMRQMAATGTTTCPEGVKFAPQETATTVTTTQLRRGPRDSLPLGW